MRVRFWGTRGSIATPGPATVHFGGNTSCVEVTTPAGARLIFDCGTGARALGAHLMATAPKPLRASILLGHSHWDHIQGFPFFAPGFVPGNSLTVYAPSGGRRSLQELLAGQMEYTYFPVELAQLPAAIAYEELGEGTYDVDGTRVLTQFLHHPAVALGYRVEADGVSVAYLTDHEPFSEALWRSDAEPGRIEALLHEGDRRHARFMAGADLVIHDAQYTPAEYAEKRNWGHSTYRHVVELAAAVGVRRVALTHHDPGHDDAFVADIERRARALAEDCGAGMDVFCAYEGWELVLTAGDAAPERAAADSTAPAAAPPRGRRILVVDDDPLLRNLARRVLQEGGHTVIESADGASGLRLVETQAPDLVVLDLGMPGMSGLDVLKAIRARPERSGLPVLLLTARGEEQAVRAGFDHGATDYLVKPFAIPQLLSRVHACLARGAKG